MHLGRHLHMPTESLHMCGDGASELIETDIKHGCWAGHTGMIKLIIAAHSPPLPLFQLSGGFNRELVREGLVVELSDGIRKVRRLFLFHDVLVSAKQKPSR